MHIRSTAALRRGAVRGGSLPGARLGGEASRRAAALVAAVHVAPHAGSEGERVVPGDRWSPSGLGVSSREFWSREFRQFFDIYEANVFSLRKICVTYLKVLNFCW